MSLALAEMEFKEIHNLNNLERIRNIFRICKKTESYY